MPAATAHASGQWIGMSAEYLREQRADVLIETTLRSPEAMAATIAGFREAGYVVELRVVAVPDAVSRLATVERYTGQVESTGAGRWTPAAAHDEAYTRAVATVEGLVLSGAIDRFVVEDRAGAVLFDRSYFGVRDGGLRTAGREAGIAFEAARNVDQMTPDAANAWLDLARVQIERVKTQGHRDSDLWATIERICTVDALAVAARAYPQDPAHMSAVTDALSGALLPAPPAPSTGRSATRASYPQAATQATTRPPQTEPQGRPQAHHSGPYLPGRGSGTGIGK